MRTKLPPMGASVLRELCQRKRLTIPDLQDLLDVSAPTMTRSVNQLIELGAISGTMKRQGGLGRPAKVLGLEPDGLACVAVSIAPRESSAALVSLTGETKDMLTLPITTETHYAEAVETTADAVRLLIGNNRGKIRALSGVGITFGGAVSFSEGRIAHTSSFPEWRGMPIASDVEAATRLQTFVDNHPVAILRAFSWFGPLTDHSRYLCFADQGVAGCVSGPGGPRPDNGLTSGAFGHVGGRDRGNRRCWCGAFDCLNTVGSLRSITTVAEEQGLVDSQARPGDIVKILEQSDEGRALLAEAGTSLVERTIDACRVLGISEYVLAGRLFEYSPTVREAASAVMSSTYGASFFGDFVSGALARDSYHLSAAAVGFDGMAESGFIEALKLPHLDTPVVNANEGVTKNV